MSWAAADGGELQQGFACLKPWDGKPWKSESASECTAQCARGTSGCEWNARTLTCGVTLGCQMSAKHAHSWAAANGRKLIQGFGCNRGWSGKPWKSSTADECQDQCSRGASGCEYDVVGKTCGITVGCAMTEFGDTSWASADGRKLVKGFACLRPWQGKPWKAKSPAECEAQCTKATTGCEFDADSRTCGLTLGCTMARVDTVSSSSSLGSSSSARRLLGSSSPRRLFGVHSQSGVAHARQLSLAQKSASSISSSSSGVKHHKPPAKRGIWAGVGGGTLLFGFACFRPWKGKPWLADSVQHCRDQCARGLSGCEWDEQTAKCGITIGCRLTQLSGVSSSASQDSNLADHTWAASGATPLKQGHSCMAPYQGIPWKASSAKECYKQCHEHDFLATKAPSVVPYTIAPTTKTPTFAPTQRPSAAPTNYPSHFPTPIPSEAPSWPYHINSVWPKDWEPSSRTINTYVRAGIGTKASSKTNAAKTTCALRLGYTCMEAWKQKPSRAVSAAACQRKCEALSNTDGEGCEYDSKTSTCGVTAKCSLTKSMSASGMHAALCRPLTAQSK